MKTLTFLLFTFLLTLTAQAQPYDLKWAKRVGGNNDEHSRSMTADAYGNIYSIGSFRDTVDFNPGIFQNNLISAGGNDIFILKLDFFGNFVWAKRMGGPGEDIGYSISLDPSGKVYIAGSFSDSADFNPGTAKYEMKSAGASDIFMAKLDWDGNFVWAKRMGNYFEDVAFQIAIDKSNNICASGYFVSTVDFDPSGSVYNLDAVGGVDVFVAKYDSSGKFIWAKKAGSGGDEYGTSMALDTAGNIYTLASYQGTVDFDPSAAVYNLVAAGKRDIFMLKLNSSGNFVWAKSMGGPNDDWGNAIASDAFGNVYATGTFQETADFNPASAAFDLKAEGESDIFILKLNTEGNFIWAKKLGGPLGDYSFGIAVDTFGNVFNTGGFQGTGDFDPSASVFPLTANGATPDVFISKLDSAGNFIWADEIGGLYWDLAYDIIVTNVGDVITTGIFSGTANFDLNSDTIMLSAQGKSDIFLFKIGNVKPSVLSTFSLENEARFYPNPTNDRVTFCLKKNSYKNLQVQVRNTFGQIVLSEFTDAQNNTFNMSDLASGNYFVQIIENGNTIAAKTIMKN